MLYEKADRPPKAGSLREALFLHIWLNREEQRVKSTLIVAEGLAEITAASGGKTSIPVKFKEYMEAVFPFTAKENTASDEKQKEVLKKEAARGPITFTTGPSSTLRAATKKLSMPDNFRKNLLDKAKRTR